MRFLDLTGKTFNRWTVLRRAADIPGSTRWLCRCSCGTEREVSSVPLRSGSSRSCGCLRSEENTGTHGHARKGHRTPEYISWQAMISRCRNPNNPSYEEYGGRGIKVAARWSKFENFLADMGPRPQGLSLDRIHGSKNYTKSNCRWASSREQILNRHTTHRTSSGVPLIKAAEAAGISYNAVKQRKAKGWPESRWFEPVRETKRAWKRQQPRAANRNKYRR